MRAVKQALSTLRDTLMVEDEDEEDDAQLTLESLSGELTSMGNSMEKQELEEYLRELERDNKLMFRGGVIHLI